MPGLARIATAIWIASLPFIAHAATVEPAKSPIDEIRRSFTIDGRPIPPELFRDFGDGDLADSEAIWVTADLRAATGSNLYADPIKADGGWVTQTKQAAGTVNGSESTAYKLIGAAANGLLVVVASYNGGGSGTFYTLHILDIADQAAFDGDGKSVRRLAATLVRSIPLGDRWSGDVSLSGNTIVVGTTREGPADATGVSRTITFEAVRP